MLNKIRENFISETKEKSKLNYNRKIEIFMEFLKQECGVNNKNYVAILKGMGIDEIIKSLEYYIHNYGIQYTSTADNYITAMRSFFLYLAQKENIYNKIFDRQAENEKFNEGIKLKYKELGLIQTKMKEIISECEFNQLLLECNKHIQRYDVYNYEKEGSYKTETGLFLSSIMMKLVMYTGIKNSVIPTILKKDYDYDLNKIMINGIVLYLPDDLSYNFKKYYKVREELLRENNIEDADDSELFINQNCEYIKSAVSGDIYKLMKKELDTTEGEGLCKYVIMNQIAEGIDVLELMELTRFSIDTCMHCKEQLNIETNKTGNTRINSKLRDSRLYKIL
ncbi:hypothetical protein [Clostridium butyricum]|uniref:hypothetical protein n=1 Tax=Clostridium butyricum TaxID=1492 RepID=UPI0009034C93|nr:hypothetical protein [Clostridium butyricum]APF22001.1 hypothetical protein NPD4_2434 [Clostridium butyricum]